MTTRTPTSSVASHTDGNSHTSAGTDTGDNDNAIATSSGAGRLCLVKVRKPRRDKRRHASSSTSSLSLSSTANLSATSSNNINNSTTNTKTTTKNKKNTTTAVAAAAMATTTNTTNPSTPAGAATTAIKDDVVMDLSDPLAIIALAVRFDESWQDETILRVPLESGRIHSRKNFLRSLLYLQKKTALPTTTTTSSSPPIPIPPPPSSTTTMLPTTNHNSNNNNNNNNTLGTTRTNPHTSAAGTTAPSARQKGSISRGGGGGGGGGTTRLNGSVNSQPFAITPVIVSGFLALAAEQEHDRQIIEDMKSQQLQDGENNNNNNNNSNTTDINHRLIAADTKSPGVGKSPKPRQQQQQPQKMSTAETNVHSNTTTIMDDNNAKKATTTTTTTAGILPNSTELVQYCHSMRHAAIVRVRFRNRRRTISKILSPILIVLGLSGLYWWTMSTLNFVVLDLAYFESCMEFSSSSSSSSSSLSSTPSQDSTTQRVSKVIPSYNRACRSAQASLWEKVYPAQFSYYYHQEYNALQKQQKEQQQQPLSKSPQESSSKRKFVCNLEECSKSLMMVEGQRPMPYYAMHTTLMQSIIPLEQVPGLSSERHRRRKGQSQYLTTHHQHYHRHPGRATTSNTNAERTPLQWLGETIVNGLVREALEDHFSNITSQLSSSAQPSSTSQSASSTTTFALLDVGCGIGGTMYALLPPFSVSSSSSSPATIRRARDSSITTAISKASKIIYRGISISAPEIYQAQRLFRLHEIDVTGTTKPSTSSSSSSSSSLVHDFQFVHQSFDDPLPVLPATTTTTNNKNVKDKISNNNHKDGDSNKLYTSMVAIESLSYSHNVSYTLANLASSLHRGGMLIVVDDVIAPWAVEETSRNEESTTMTMANVADLDDLSAMNPIKAMQHISGRSSLLTHEEWTNHLESQGFVIQKVQDLGLEFDLPFAQPSSNPSSSGWWQTVLEWRRRPALFILQKWQRWLESGKNSPVQQQQHDNDSGDPGQEKTVDADNETSSTIDKDLSLVPLAVVQLLQDFVYKSWVTTLLNDAHRNGDLSYYMYVCVKA